jgi:hypothetical protein
MARSQKKLSAKAKKYDMLIRAKGTSSRIIEIGQGNIVRVETVSKGRTSGKYYNGTHWDTVEVTMQRDGTAQLNIKYIHVTNKGETVVGTGTGLQEPDSAKGIAKFNGEGTMWTISPGRLSQLNGARWTCEGDYNMIKEAVEVRVTINISV